MELRPGVNVFAAEGALYNVCVPIFVLLELFGCETALAPAAGQADTDE